MSPIKPEDQHELARLTYAMAYVVLPQYLNEKPDKAMELLQAGPQVAGMFFYTITCKLNDDEPNESLMPQFVTHQAELDQGDRCFVIQYPKPPQVNIADLPEDQMIAAAKDLILAPYFSAVVQYDADPKLGYFVLGQSLNGFTTLRTVTTEVNANLGPGCEPDLDAFIELLMDRV